MTRFVRARRAIAATLVLGLSLSATVQPVMAQAISTEQAATVLMASPQASEARARLNAALDRADLAQALADRGVSIDQVRARVAALTDAEAAEVLRQIDSAPAGADVIGTLVTVFVILLVSDILGLTKVFPFSRSVR